VELGELLAEGATCRVYGWGVDRVVKVYRRAFVSLASVEAERAAAIHAAGVPSPAPHGLVEVGDRSDGCSSSRSLRLRTRTSSWR